MTQEEHIRYWVDSANYDLETAEAMLQTRRFLYVGFTFHLAIEKMLKAYFVKSLNEIPPFTHNLEVLATKSGLIRELSDSQLNLFDKIAPMNIEGRYPSYKSMLIKSLNEEVARNFIEETKAFVSWITKKL